MLVQLATHIEDPFERLEKICQNTQRGKTYQGATGAKRLSNLAEVVPFGIANQAARLYSRFHLAKLHNPVFNVVITNVPGPTIPLYLQGHKLKSIMGMAPIIDGMGLIITILSYDGTITISPTSDAASMPDLDLFSDLILESANNLEKIILKKEIEIKSKQSADLESKKKETSFTHSFFEYIRKYLKTNKDFIKKPVGHFQFIVESNNQEVFWQLNLSKPPGSVRKGKTKTADVSLSLEEKHLKKIAAGKLNITTAFIQGRIKMEGDSDIAMKMASILKQLPPFV
jgi:putative sterol carrier protein